MTTRILHGDCLDILPTLDACSFDAVVTDPPYELGFMGRAWDRSGVAVRPETWAEVLRVLKPGGHMLCFGGSRTSHRMACAIEDAGFEVRDTLMFLYATGFPKSLDVSKAIDKAAGAVREVVGIGATRSSGMRGGSYIGGDDEPETRTATTPATPEAAHWSGWGSALKPAFEPILLCRKPLSEHSIAANVLKHGVGGINIDACRIPGVKGVPWGKPSDSRGSDYGMAMPSVASDGRNPDIGRFPANVLHDGSDEVMAAFAAYGERSSGGYPPEGGQRSHVHTFGKPNARGEQQFTSSTGSAARFFYSAKASKADRADSKHPTVKPLSLVSWLCKLITPPGGCVLDPFAGSGITAEACMTLGFDCTLVDIEADHVRDIRHRIKRWSGLDAPLFADVAAQ